MSFLHDQVENLPAIRAMPMARDIDLATGTVFAASSSALVVSAVLGLAVGRHVDRWNGRYGRRSPAAFRCHSAAAL